MKRNIVAWAALVVSTAALISSQGVTRPIPAATPDIAGEGQKAAQNLSEAFEAVADFVRPSVVQISTQRKASPRTATRRAPDGNPANPDDPHGDITPDQMQEMLKKFFGPGFKPEKNQFGIAQGTGSGFVYDELGHILTNNHVVEDADRITVTFYDGTELPAKVVGRDKDTDVAVIKVESTEFRPMKTGKSAKLRVGEWVLAVGAPFGLSQTVTAGIISATERAETGITNFGAFIQTDAAINPGNSGGPLVDMNGRVVGINTAIVTGDSAMGARSGNAGVGFSIPIDLAANLADKLIKDGKVNVARLGIGMDNVTPRFLKELGLDTKLKGVIVTQILKGSPAEKAGLKVDDILTKFAGDPIPNRGSFRVRVATSDIGKPIELTLLRDGKSQTLSVTLGSKADVVFEQERERPTPVVEKPAVAKVEFDDFGLELQPATPALAKQFGYPTDSSGLIVSGVKAGSVAESVGVREGSLISKVVDNQRIRPIKSLDEFQALATKKDELAIFVQTPAIGGQLSPGQYLTLAKPKKD